MNAIIIYHSRTGFTQKYAYWLGELLGCNCIPYRNRKQIDFTKYDIIIYGASFYASKIIGIKWYQTLLARFPHKKHVVFAVGASPMDSPDVPQALENNFGQLQQKIKVFYLQGGLNYERMNWLDKRLMGMMVHMLQKKQQKTPTDEMALRMLQTSYDITDIKYLQPIVAYLKNES